MDLDLEIDALDDTLCTVDTIEAVAECFTSLDIDYIQEAEDFCLDLAVGDADVEFTFDGLDFVCARESVTPGDLCICVR